MKYGNVIIVVLLILLLLAVLSYVITMIQNKPINSTTQTDNKCTSNASCIEITKPYCDYSTGVCVECVSATNCESEICTDNICELISCEDDNDCTKYTFEAYKNK